LLGVGVEDGGVDVAQVGFGVEKIVTQDNGAESFDGGGKLLVGIGRSREALKFGGEAAVDSRDAFFSVLQSFLKGLDGGGADLGFAEGDVEARDGGAVAAQDVQEVGEIRPRERPVPQDFLRVLIDVHDDDGRIGGCGAGRAITEAGVQRVVFKALKERKDGSGALAEKSEVIQGEGGQGDDQADEEGNAVVPPSFKQFDKMEDAETACVFGWWGGH
jgi:hypothetical protein